jgi:hypothetical protein
MNFTQQELADTASELRTEINRFLSQQTKPDVLLGTHPAVAFASQKHSIAIWHGHRIEDHLSDWINKVPNWKAKARERVTINGVTHEIDNLAWNPQLDIVLAVEAKRVWANQDSTSVTGVNNKHKLYMDPGITPRITSRAGLPSSDFRHFVFDVYGNTKTGKNGLPIIAGDKIGRIFDPTLAKYVEWERRVIANAMFETLDPKSQDPKREQILANEILSGSPLEASSSSKQSILGYIDQHAA